MKVALGLIAILGVGLVACKPGDTPSPQSSAPPAAAAPQATAPLQAAPGELVKNVVADSVPYQAEAAKVEGNSLVTTGVPGFVMFGPYVPLAAGTYHVTVNGNIQSIQQDSSIKFDVVSSAGGKAHGEQTITSSEPANGQIASFDFTLPEDVVDLELRAQVGPGVQMGIDSYRVAKAE